MTNKENLKKQIIYRSTHRGTKEMDILLGNFVKKYIDDFTVSDLDDLKVILLLDDEEIHKWYFDKKDDSILPISRVSKMLRNFKL
tara:strand:- start:51 stop:305 length:255 start_codon:yes stop_codon:yes gene_type:complete